MLTLIVPPVDSGMSMAICPSVKQPQVTQPVKFVGCAFNGLSAFSLGIRLLCLSLEALPFLLPNLSSYLLLSYLLWLGNQVISLCVV